MIGIPLNNIAFSKGRVTFFFFFYESAIHLPPRHAVKHYFGGGGVTCMVNGCFYPAKIEFTDGLSWAIIKIGHFVSGSYKSYNTWSLRFSDKRMFGDSSVFTIIFINFFGFIQIYYFINN